MDSKDALSKQTRGLTSLAFAQLDPVLPSGPPYLHSVYTQEIHTAWTPVKPVTTQFAVGRNRAAQVIRRQFPLRPAAAKTIHKPQGDTERKIVLDFHTKRTIPHIHYVGLSRVTTIDGLYN